MAALEKDVIGECVEIFLSIHSETVLNLFYELTILLFCFEVALNSYFKKSANREFFKNIFRSIN